MTLKVTVYMYTLFYFPVHLKVVSKRSLFSDMTAHCIMKCICTFTTPIFHHLRFIPKGVAERSQTFLQDAPVLKLTLPKILTYKEYCIHDRWEAHSHVLNLTFMKEREW
jgi:hypothetical protein